MMLFNKALIIQIERAGKFPALLGWVFVILRKNDSIFSPDCSGILLRNAV
ncbi:hypothetical protein FIC_01597 [Flavobacteriaceae bacterium 3519-10]|nr:hypothetical protein FIC_01597 [Flavobacteriaceae bacterium 3519-10]